LSNKDLEQLVETNDDWIASRTGIRRRHILGKHERQQRTYEDFAPRCRSILHSDCSHKARTVKGCAERTDRRYSSDSKSEDVLPTHGYVCEGALS